MWGIAWNLELFKIWGAMVALPNIQFAFLYVGWNFNFGNIALDCIQALLD
jgi:hypothetical protein